MDSPNAKETPEGDWVFDEIITSEIGKIEQWKREGIDTGDLERLLFEDIEEYNKEKIRILSEHLELPRPTSGTRLDNSIEPSFEHEKNDVITNIPIEDHKSTKNPTFNHRISLLDEKTPLDKGKTPSRSKAIGRKKRMSIRITIILFSIGSMILLSGVISYLIMKENNGDADKLDAFFTISDLKAISGSVIKLRSMMKDDGASHFWLISPSDFIIIEGGLEKSSIDLYFTKSGTYSITHEVKKGEESKAHTDKLEVEPHTLRIDRESIGDISKYDVTGNLRVSNVRSLIDIPEASSFKNLEMDFWSEEVKPTKSTLSYSDGSFKDGYAMTYSTILRTNEHNLVLSGSIEKYDRSKIPFSGKMETNDRTDIDLYNRKASRTIINNFMQMNIQLQPGSSRTYSIKEDMTIYPELSEFNYDIRLDDIAKDRYMSEDETGNILWGSSLLNWKAVGVLRFRDKVCINVSLWMDRNTLDNNKLDSFSMNLYLSDAIPVSLRTLTYIKTKDTIENPYTLSVEQRIIDINKGSNPIIYGNIDDQHTSITNIIQIKPELLSIFHDNWTYVPIYGTMKSSIPSDFDAEQAVEQFSSKQTFINFISGLKDPYSLNSNYSEMTGAKVWKFSISEADNQWAWNQTVIKDTPVSTGFKSRIEPVGVERNDIISIMTISGAESLFKTLMSDLDPVFTRSLYGVSQPDDQNLLDMSNWAITFISDNPYPGIGTMNQGTFMRIPYSMDITSKDGRFEASIDMESGQICYFITRSKL